MTLIAPVTGPLILTGRLLVRFWPQLLLVAAIGYVLRELLLRAAVWVGLVHPLGGMVVLSLVVLVKLAVVVMMFLVLRPGLPALNSLSRTPARSAEGAPADRNDGRMLAVTAAAILPFFAYYAAWGFLGDTVREYSRLALDHVQLGAGASFLDVLSSQGLLLSIVACWVVRWFAKRMNKQARSPYWRLLVVAADASWIFIGLYGISIWKDEFISWLGAGSLLDELSQGAGALLVSVAHAAADSFTPVEFRPSPWPAQLQSLFFYALLPMVWLVMAAIINGCELSASRPSVAAAPRGGTLWKWMTDFTDHFVSGYRARYRPVWICLKMTLGSGFLTLASFVIAYRLIGWLGAWAWYGASRLLGPHDLDTWQVIFGAISVFIGSPSDLDGGVLLDAARIALLAAMLEHAVGSQRQAGSAMAAS